MIKRIVGPVTVLAAVTAVFALALVVAAAQGDTARERLAGCSEYPPDFHPCATTKAKTFDPPRTPDGQPDMRGVWWTSANGATHSLEKGCCTLGDSAVFGYARRPKLTVIVEPPDHTLPYQPWAAAKRQSMLVDMVTPTKLEHIEPEDRCLPQGVPRISFRGVWRIIQVPGYVVIAYEWNHAARIIPTDGRSHQLGEAIKLWNGDSRGRWENHTLVVDTTNLKDATWLDTHGSIHSDAMHVVERFTLVDADTIHYEARIEDPKVFTRPVTIVLPVERHQDRDHELWEEACVEGLRNVEIILRGGRAAKAAGQMGIHEDDPPLEENPRQGNRPDGR